MEEDLGTSPPVPNTNRLSRFLPSCMFVQMCFPASLNHLYQALPVLSGTSQHSFQRFSLLLQQSSTRNTATLPSTERSRGSKGRSQGQRRRVSETKVQMGLHLHPICLHPAPFGLLEVLPLRCGRTYLMSDPAVSSTTSATRRENYKRWRCASASSLPFARILCLTVFFSPQAKFELVTSEASYIRSLIIAVDHFMLSQELSECLGAQDKQWLFSKLPEVKDVSERWRHIELIASVGVLTPQLSFPRLWASFSPSRL